jgi:hypothetical protein
MQNYTKHVRKSLKIELKLPLDLEQRAEEQRKGCWEFREQLGTRLSADPVGLPEQTSSKIGKNPFKTLLITSRTLSRWGWDLKRSNITV